MWNALTQYHPRIGFTFMPSVKSRISFENGGYLIRTNAAGFRSDREFVPEATPGKFRALLFGDSQTAGDGVPNPDRYSDFLEKMTPDLEVYNYGMPLTGVDQHYLAYQECGNISRDLTIIGLYVENIGRVANRFMPCMSPEGKEVIYAKPYYEIEGDELKLHHVPAPKHPLTKESMSPEDAKHVYWGVPFVGLRNVVKKLGMRDLIQKVTKFQPIPDYDSPTNPRWLLLRRILTEWIKGSPTPVLLYLLPMWPFVEESADPTGYQTRFREVAEETGCYLHDPLPDLWKYSPEERRAFRFKIDSHFTTSGHKALAASLTPYLQKIIAELKPANR